MAKKNVENYLVSGNEYYEIVKEILESAEFQKRKTYLHHENCTVYEHCLMVSFLSYLWAKKWKCDYKSAAIGGLLHDFYDKPWQTNAPKSSGKKKTKFLKQHGFVHAGEAVANSYRYFPTLMNQKVENIIRRHMFPLNICPPRYKEAWIITCVDKYVSMDVLKNPKVWPKYLGLGKKEKK